MAQTKTSSFLPEAFKTETNKKFLNATLDQLVTKPDLRNVNGYIGRKFAPTFKSTDNYQPEPTALRQNYQLEPGVVVKNKSTGETEFFSSYIDLLQQVGHYGGITNNQSRLFAGESYSFDGLFDFDKFVNFNQYYWLKDGVAPVNVFSSEVPTQQTYTVTRNPATGSYMFSTDGTVENPTLRLAYGGVYKFIVDQPGYPFWIQVSPGVSGTKTNQTNLTGRDVLGVVNNGIEVGTVTFSVPLPTAQDFFVRMPLAGSADLSTTLLYNQVHNKRLSDIIMSGEGGIDGVRASGQLNLKSLIFVGNVSDDIAWTTNDGVVDIAYRRNAWQIKLSTTNGIIDADPIVTLNPLQQSFAIGPLEKVFVKGGVSRAEYTYYLDSDYLLNNIFKLMPDITAPLTTLYYQDGVNSSYVGQIDLLAVGDTTINVEKDIIGKTTYKSPNGVTFTNGLKVTFVSATVPSSYAGNTYYIEGVGKSIRLLDVNDLVTPESYAANGLGKLDYITINRSSLDSNPWSRSNRWFHIDVINATAEYNNTISVIDQTLRANRPIIEFEADLQLYNFGRIAKVPVDLLDFTITDAFNQVELQAKGYSLGGVTLTEGMRVVFANDFDPAVVNQIYIVNIVYITNLSGYYINLVPAGDSTVTVNNNLVVLQGTNKGTEYYFNGTNWINGQQKTTVNQAPLFDVVDSNGYSLHTYTNSTFTGTKIFSYQHGTGANDTVLGFPLSYRNFNQIGDIQFDNNFDGDTFSYIDGAGVAQTANINTKGTLQQNTSLTAYKLRNTWITNLETSKQFQIIGGVYDGNNPYFKIDIASKAEAKTPYFRVYRNSQPTTGYELVTVGVITYVHITDTNLTTGDQIDILIHSDSVSALGYYEVPKNLDLNSENANFTSLTLGQLRNHVTTMVGNSNQIVGAVPGASNLRDIDIKPQGGSILQHSAPVLYSELFLVDQNTNFIKSLNLARHEYSKIKNKIIELSARTSGLDYSNIPVLLDTLLKTINGVKNNTFPWYYSDMVPYGDVKNTITYTVLGEEIVDYEISSVFSDTTLSNRAVLIYLNGVQLVKDVDYMFDANRSGVTITTPMQVDDVITIYEYSNTDGNYIPETPTKLGLYPKFTPAKLYDTTYSTPIYVIQGHDGSITPAFGDYRDDLLLEFEKRIYNNIKVNYQKNIFDVYDYLPGKFRTTDYSNKDFTQLLTNSFLQWVGGNRVDYVTNSYFVASEPFTWNYGRFQDTIDGETLLGYWRGIYRYFYDTDRPHTHPWEMLGFSQQPAWWETRYGPAPYTGGNLVLWEDLAAGFVWNNGDSYTDSRFVRPGLLNIIPVDDTGTLRSPDQFAVKNFNSNQASGNYKIGDCAPVESAWRRSSDYPYAVQQALALSHPAFYFGSLVDIGRYYKNTDLNQYVLSDTLQRITPDTINLNGVTVNGVVARSASYINWIAEYLRNQGIDPAVKLTEYLSNVNIQLAYKSAGYTDQSFIEVIAEQSSPTSANNGVVVPKENYSIELYKSTPVSTITYSAVVVEKSPSGYTVSGFDFDNPYFTIIPSLANNNSYPIKVLNDTAVVYGDYQKYKVTVPYGFEFTKRQQVVDFLVSYQRFLRGSGLQFTEVDPDLGVQRDFLLSIREFLTWAQQGWQANSVLVLSPVLNKLSGVTTRGVIDQIQNQPNQSRVLDTGYNFVKYNQMSVSRENTANGNAFSITALNGQTISLVKLDVIEYEHVIIFDNKTVFNDVIYVPELGNRQYRLKLVGKKTGAWTGALNPPGFIYNNTKIDTWQPGVDYPLGSLVRYKNNNYTAIQNIIASTTFNTTSWAQLSANEVKTGLLPNFSYNAEKFNRFNDIDNPETLGKFEFYSDSTIGFRPRDYLTNFGINDVTQAKFYQGFIREKGTKNSVTAFTAAGFNGVTSDISLYEEWAMRVGEYGALDNNKSIDLILTESTFNSDPVTLTLLPNGASASTGIIGVYPEQLYNAPAGYTPDIYNNRDRSSRYENDIQTAGYVNVNDVDTTVFNITDYTALTANLSQVGVGYTIWCAKDLTNDWNVYRVTETDISVTQIAYGVDNIGTVTTNKPHGFVRNDLFVIKGFDYRVDGFYSVYAVINDYNFSVVFTGTSADQIKQALSITNTGPVFKLQSVRIKTPTDLNSITPAHGWLDDDKLWIDTDAVTNGWAVYNKSTPWAGNVSYLNPSMKLWANNYVGSTGFGTVTAISASGAFAAAGIPALNNGNVAVFVANVSNGNVLTQVANVGAPTGNIVTKFGASLDISGNVLYVGAPGNGSTEYGRVHVYQFDGNATFTRTQTITSPWSSNTGDAYGTSVSASADGTWLFVGAPNAGNVYVYHANTNSYYSYANTITVGSAAYDQFGFTVRTTSDASQTVIAAPYQTVNGKTAAGAAYVYDRSVETFVANGNTKYFPKYPIIASTLKVTVNGNVVTSGFTSNANCVTFSSAPIVGSLINIDTNKIQLMQQLTTPAPSSGAAFGITTHISGNDADVYVASPGYSVAGYHSGIVYRFVNQGASYGSITSNITAAGFTGNVSVGDSIRINGIDVVMTGGNIITANADINAANIAGVSSVAEGYGALTITSQVHTPYQRLVITPGSGNIVGNLGLEVYSSVQTLLHPATDDVNSFGSQVLSSPDSSSLVISASGGSTQNITTFDNAQTSFDYGSVSFVDTIFGSGMVYVYGLVNGAMSTTTQDQYVLIQRLQNQSLTLNDQFGYSVAMNGNTMLVGAPGDSSSLTIDPNSGAYVPISSAGTYYTYHNFSGNVGWDIIANQEEKVDIESIGNFYLYNTNTNVILDHLDYIDPAKGKVLGVAQQDLDYITAYDPAVYNTLGGIDGTPNLPFSLDFHWGPAQVTQTWWNIDSMRYVDYEQGSITYRANNWGRMFPGSTVQVCEWVESDMPPSMYAGPGTALYPDNSAYVVETVINPNTGLVNSKYYYWVTGKTSIEPESTHKSTVATIADVIANPQAQGIPYAAVVRNDSISLYNLGEYISGNTTVFHADYDTLKNTNIIHSEYQLIGEGDNNSNIPQRIIDKIIDSLSGVDANGNPVTPLDENGNYLLPPQQRLGLGKNQTLFVDRKAGLKNLVEYMNGVFIKYPIVAESNISALYSAEPLPDAVTYDLQVASYAELAYVDKNIISTGYVVLVTNDETQQGIWTTYTLSGANWVLTSKQSYYTPFYWRKVDWYDATYDSSVLPTHVVATYADILTISAVVGDTIKVINNGAGEFAIYRVNSSGGTDLVGIENGTIQFNSNLYTSDAAGIEIRVILSSYTIFITNFDVNLNDLLFFIINYILSEQPAVDWVFKTSFVTILHKLRKLNQPANYIPDNQTYYENYINEVKPYRTSIREYRIDYEGNDEYLGDTTDFDIPSTYINAYGGYRSPNGTDGRDSTWLSTLPQYNQWYNNYGYGISEVLVTNSGSGYYFTPQVTVIGGGGAGANIAAVVDFTSNSITRFDVISPGSGYTSQPTIFINGTGTGAVGYAKLKNHYQIDNLPYTEIVANTSVTVYAGNIITQPNTGAYGTVYQSSTGNLITLIDVVGTFANYQYLYSDFANLGTTSSNVINSYDINPINNSYNTVRNITTTVKFDRVNYTSNIIAWQPNITVSADSWISYNNQAYQAMHDVYSTTVLTLNGNATVALNDYVTQANATGNARVLSVSSNLQLITLGNITGTYAPRGGNISVNGVATQVRPIAVNNIFDYTKYDLLSSDTFTSATDRITAYYAPTSGMPGKDLSQLMTGISYPGITVEGVKFDANTSVLSTGNVLYAYSNIGTLFSSNISVVDFTKLNYTIGESLTIVNDDTNVTYKVTIAQISSSQLIGSGITSDIVKSANISLKYYDFNNPAYLDTNISNTYTNTQFGTSPNDVSIDGGAYYDTYSSHAPEELVPGAIYDNLNMLVVTGINGNTETVSYRVVHDMTTTSSNIATLVLNKPISAAAGANVTQYISGGNAYSVAVETVSNSRTLKVLYWGNVLTPFTDTVNANIFITGTDTNANVINVVTPNWPKYYGVSADHTTTLSQDLAITDSNIHVVDASALTAPDLVRLHPGVVYINGEKTTFWTRDLVNNVLGQIRRAVDGTGAPAVHSAGSEVVEAALTELIPGDDTVHTTCWLDLAIAPPSGVGMLENSTTKQAVFIKNLQ